MENIYQNLIDQASNFIRNKCKGCCISLLDNNGNLLFYFKLGDPTPCSLSLSKNKAFTAYSFKMDNDKIYELLCKNGTQNLISGNYCFISGGLFLVNDKGSEFSLGVSTDIPRLDQSLALELSTLITGKKI